jgi:acid phosphatase type 7
MNERSLARDAGLLVVVFLATLVLLAGVALAFNAGPFASPPASGVAMGSPSPSASAPARTTPSSSPATPTVSPASPSADDPVLVGAGDIGVCSRKDDEATAKLLDDIPGTVFAAGDNAYEKGTTEQYDECYQPAWGRHFARTRAVPGNHEYETPDAAGYKEYFGENSLGPDGETWYSFDLGTWHVVMLDSNCDDVACGVDSDQGRWLAADLAASDARCTLAIWHHPRFSSGFHGNDRDVDPFWEILYDAGADLVVNGHDHDYERFAPMNPDGDEDRSRGMRQFVAGTGGAVLRPFEQIVPNSELRYVASHGVFKLMLHDGSYEWQFIPTKGDFSDRGSASCH